MIDSPCLGCVERVIGCHSTCIKYIDFRQRLDAYNKEKADIRNTIYGDRKYVRDAVARCRGRQS